nr:hypothetical protein BaRGS_019544 [Batillaria attramentaria]
MAVFWCTNVFFMLLDVTGRPAVLQRYKVQPGKNSPLPVQQLKRVVLVGLRNQILVGVPFVTVLYYAMRWRGNTFHPAQLSSWQQGLLEMVVIVAFEEIGFYYLHRLLHQPQLYQRFHKQHHEWTAPVGVVAIYAHPLEHATANLLPPVLGPLLLGSHLATMWCWFALAFVSTTITHSGYHFPGFPSPEFHDFHHLKFNTNYGSLGIMDRLHGTDVMFRQSEARARHRVFFSLTPISQLVHDLV